MSEHPLVVLARKTIEAYVKERKILDAPKELAVEMREKAGVFVCLKKQNSLRGCIGTFSPTTTNIAEEIIRNAIEAAAHDPRFVPVREEELKDLSISVDVLSTPETVDSIDKLNAKEYGVIVKSGKRRGLLLPDLEGVDSPEEQIAICRQKAGIGAEEPIELFRFKVRRFQ